MLQVMIGTPTRESARSIHPSLGHLGRLSYLMSKLKESSSRSIDIDRILSMQKEMGKDFILVCNLIQGVIVIQFPAMKMIVQITNFMHFRRTPLKVGYHRLGWEFRFWILDSDSWDGRNSEFRFRVRNPGNFPRKK
jgi:hypothetical protein